MPPEPANVCEYGTPTVPPGKLKVVMVNVKAMLIVKVFWAVSAGAGDESVA